MLAYLGARPQWPPQIGRLPRSFPLHSPRYAPETIVAIGSKELVRYFTRLGPVSQFWARADDKTRAAIIETVRPAFEPYVNGAEVRYTAACWIVRAHA